MAQAFTVERNISQTATAAAERQSRRMQHKCNVRENIAVTPIDRRAIRC